MTIKKPRILPYREITPRGPSPFARVGVGLPGYKLLDPPLPGIVSPTESLDPRFVLGEPPPPHAIVSAAESPYPRELLPTVPLVSDVRNRRAATIDLEPDPYRSGRMVYPQGCRVAGTYSHPEDVASLAFVEAALPGATRRVSFQLIDVNPTRSSFGAPLGGKRHVMSGSSTMLGVAGVSYQAPIGDRVSGLFAFVDVGRAYPSPFPPWSLPPRGLFVFDATPSVAVAPIATLVRGIDHRTVAPIIPALESGRFRRGFGVSSMKILLAWSSRSGREVRIGFLRRDADGGWRFVETAAVATLPAVSNPTAPIQWNIDAAFDVTRGQWVVTWVVGNSSLDLVVIDFDGRPVGPVRKVLDFGEMIDSPGVMVAFNKFTGRYLIQLQHNLRRIRLTDRGTQCLAADGSDASCFAEEEMRDIGRAEITAIHVIYRPGWEFRSGGRCERPSVCRSRAGISEVFSLTGGYSFGGFVAKYWIPERDASGSVGELWPPGDDPIEAGRVHRYVRCPHIGATLVLHVHDNRLAGSSGDLRYSFLEGDREPVDE